MSELVNRIRVRELEVEYEVVLAEQYLAGVSDWYIETWAVTWASDGQQRLSVPLSRKVVHTEVLRRAYPDRVNPRGEKEAREARLAEVLGGFGEPQPTVRRELRGV